MGTTLGPAPCQNTNWYWFEPNGTPSKKVICFRVERTSDHKNYHFGDAQICSNSVISRSRIATCRRSSCAKPSQVRILQPLQHPGELLPLLDQRLASVMAGFLGRSKSLPRLALRRFHGHLDFCQALLGPDR